MGVTLHKIKTMDEQSIHINIPAVQQYASYLRKTAREINQKQESLIGEVGRVSQYWRDDDYQRFRSEIIPVIRELAAFQQACMAEAMRLEEIARAAGQVGWGKRSSRITLFEGSNIVAEQTVSVHSTRTVVVPEVKTLGSLKRDDGLRLKDQIEGGVPEGYAAHHLITVNEAKDSIALQKAAEAGYNINHGHNGIALPTTAEEAERTGLPLHSGRHLTEYTTHVSEWLEILDEEYIRAEKSGKPWSQEQLFDRINMIEDAIRKEITLHKIALQNDDPNKTP